jgi:outer membrane protein OmpA-like peptidoglycan-associated protein
MKHVRWSSIGLCAALILGAAAMMPRAADAQIWKTIKEHAKKKAAEKTTEAATRVVETSNGVVDSSLTKTGRGVDTLVNKAGTVADTAMNKTEHGVASVAKSLTGGGGGDKIKASLAAGRLVLADLKFAPGSPEVSTDGGKSLDKVAKAILSTNVTYLVESHATDGADAAANQSLSEKRGAAVKARLVAAGVPTTRLFVMSFGDTRPATSGSSNRIEIAKMQ